MNGCASYNASTMYVWQPIYNDFVPNSELQHADLFSSDSIQLFYFKLKSKYFPIKPTPYTAACYIQTTGGLKSANTRRSTTAVTEEQYVHETKVELVAVKINTIIESPVEPTTSTKQPPKPSSTTTQPTTPKDSRTIVSSTPASFNSSSFLLLCTILSVFILISQPYF